MKLGTTQKLWMLLLNGLGFAIAAGAVALGFALRAPGPVRATAALALLYLVPPVTARFLLWALPIRSQRISIGSREYLVWWAVFNLQVIFARFPALEEILRLIPWAYSPWLRLWGSRVGRHVYWTPGVCIVDRSFLDIGSRVIFGAGVRLNPHVMRPAADGDMELLLAPVRIGDDAVIGGYALLTAGTEIAAGECTRACLLSPPFSRWHGGRRIREPDAKDEADT